MENFEEKYKQLSNIDLLTIVREGESYKPKALQAAKEELRSRNISLEEMEIVDQHFAGMDAYNNKLATISSLPSRMLDYMQPHRDVAGKMTTESWVRLFVVGQCLIGARSLYILLSSLYLELKFANVIVDFFQIAVILIDIAFISLTIYFLFKKSYWGWALVFARSLMLIFNILLSLYYTIVYDRTAYIINDKFTIYKFFWLILYTVFIIFLLRKSVMHLFKANQKTMINAILGAASFLLFLYAFSKQS